MAKKKIKKVLANEADKQRAHDIVAEDLGEGFKIDYGIYPKNVGVKGDEGIYGDTLLITSKLEDPIAFIVNEADFMDGVASRLFNEIYPLTKVVFDITPPSPRHTDC